MRAEPRERFSIFQTAVKRGYSVLILAVRLDLSCLRHGRKECVSEKAKRLNSLTGWTKAKGRIKKVK